LERNERRGGGAGGARRPKQRESIEHAMGVANRFLMPPPFLSSVMRCPSAFLTHTGTSPATHKPAAPLGCINQPHPSKPRSHLAHMHPVCPHRQRHIHPVVDEKRHPPPATHGQHGGGLGGRGGGGGWKGVRGARGCSRKKKQPALQAFIRLPGQRGSTETSSSSNQQRAAPHTQRPACWAVRAHAVPPVPPPRSPPPERAPRPPPSLAAAPA
jgi:hypothetical protein